MNINAIKPMTFILLEDDINMSKLFEDSSNSRTDIQLVAKTNSSYEAIQLVEKLMPEAIIVDLELHNRFWYWV